MIWEQMLNFTKFKNCSELLSEECLGKNAPEKNAFKKMLSKNAFKNEILCIKNGVLCN